MGNKQLSALAATIFCTGGLCLAAGCGTAEDHAAVDRAWSEEGQLVSGIGYRVRVSEITTSTPGYVSVFPGADPGEKVVNVGWEAIDANGATIPGFAGMKLDLAGRNLLVQLRGCDIRSGVGCEAFPHPRIRLYVILATGLSNFSTPSVTSPLFNTESATTTATCPTGTVALAGGWEVIDVNLGGKRSEPLETFFRGGAATAPIGFAVTGKRPVPGSPWRITASVVCATPPPGYQRRTYSSVPGQGIVLCASNQHVLGAAGKPYGFDAWYPITTPEATSGWSYLSSTPSLPTSLELTCIN